MGGLNSSVVLCSQARRKNSSADSAAPKLARQLIQSFKPAKDDRYGSLVIVSHDQSEWETLAVDRPGAVLEHVHPATQVVAIDEVQFFDSHIVYVVDRLAYEGKRVICAGLDADYLGKPFGLYRAFWPLPSQTARTVFPNVARALHPSIEETT